MPFFQSDLDFDDVLFIHAGEFFSRLAMAPGLLTFHPQGLQHGTQPGATERAGRATRTEEVALMPDTRRPLPPTPFAAGTELTNAWRSWP